MVFNNFCLDCECFSYNLFIVHICKFFQITFISQFSLGEQKNLRQIIIESTDIGVLFGSNLFEPSWYDLFANYVEQTPDMCLKDLAEPRVQEALKDTYDVAIFSMVFTECFFSIAHQKKVLL